MTYGHPGDPRGGPDAWQLQDRAEHRQLVSCCCCLSLAPLGCGTGALSACHG